jgi:hypothetical protein
MARIALDQLVVNGQEYVFRDRCWTTPTGYRVSTSDGQRLTLAFYEKHGRTPGAPPPVKHPGPAPKRQVQARAAR